MILLSKVAEVGITGSTIIKYYESLGYKIEKKNNRIPIGTKIYVRVEDLTSSCRAYVDVQCDGCNKLLNVPWFTYTKHVKNNGQYYCRQCANSGYKKWINLHDWCVENNKQDILDKWDYELNKILPKEVAYGTDKKYWFKCSRGLHESELIRISFLTLNKVELFCRACNSFAQWGIDNLGEDFLDKYWDWDKNNELDIDPWKTSKSSMINIWIKCQNKDYHGSNLISCANFSHGSRCPFCSQKEKVHPKDSLGAVYSQVLELWSDKNKKTPFTYTPMSNKKVWWKCKERKHNDYKRNISLSKICNFRCPRCVEERTESFLQEKVRLYLNELGYIILHEHYCTIKPQNPKTKMSLPFDNELVELKLIIEVHGIQHYEVCSWHKKSAKIHNTTPEYELHYQKLKDRYKRIYAKSQGYYYLEIPYWTDNDKEEWKELIIKKIVDIQNILFNKNKI